ncbi:transcriptional regulator [Anaerotruncus sp. 1XD22-93]|nr:transcriptional regulator [Lachnospiraceae bacterium]NBH98875.1 transcriptional regulator [Lachnospiraceae bacterium]NBI76068.1 transcriptional regulator [Lachnospiraceae bacterium]RKJ84848.1 transcriptional regulator [Anaerotruncus sp. 1XD22-93]
MVILGCGRTKAQDVIRQMNDELESKGYGRWPKGKISKTYFNQKYF